MKSAIVAEYRKLVSTRIWWMLLVVLFGYLAFMGAVLGFSVTNPPNEEAAAQLPQGAEAVKSIYSIVNGVGYMFPLVIGSLLMTTEYRHKTITQSLLVEPRRTVFLAAKFIAALPVGLLYGVVATLAVIAGSAPPLIINGDGTYLDDSSVLTVVGLGIVVIAIWTLIGVGFGSIVTNQVAAIVIILGITQFVEPILRFGLASFEATEGVSKFLPAAAADAVIGASFTAAFGNPIGVLSRPLGLVVLLGYAALFAVIARLTTLRRDLG